MSIPSRSPHLWTAKEEYCRPCFPMESWALYVCLYVIACVYVMLIIGFLRPWRTIYGTKIISFSPLMAFNFLGNVAPVKREALPLILPHKNTLSHQKPKKAKQSPEDIITDLLSFVWIRPCSAVPMLPRALDASSQYFPARGLIRTLRQFPVSPEVFPVTSPCATTWCASPWTGKETAVEWWRIFSLSQGQREYFPTHHHSWENEEAETSHWRQPARGQLFTSRWIYWI